MKHWARENKHACHLYSLASSQYFLYIQCIVWGRMFCGERVISWRQVVWTVFERTVTGRVVYKVLDFWRLRRIHERDKEKKRYFHDQGQPTRVLQVPFQEIAFENHTLLKIEVGSREGFLSNLQLKNERATYGWYLKIYIYINICTCLRYRIFSNKPAPLSESACTLLPHLNSKDTTKTCFYGHFIYNILVFNYSGISTGNSFYSVPVISVSMCLKSSFMSVVCSQCDLCRLLP